MTVTTCADAYVPPRAEQQSARDRRPRFRETPRCSPDSMDIALVAGGLLGLGLAGLWRVPVSLPLLLELSCGCSVWPLSRARPVAMSVDTLRFILAAFTGLVCSGSVQLGIFLLKRKAELRGLDAKSNATALDSANTYIQTLQAGDKALREERDSLKAELNDERQASAEALANAQREVTRLSAELGRAQSDLSVARSQIDELTRQLGGRHSASRLNGRRMRG